MKSTQRVNHGNGLVHFLLFILRLLLEPTGIPTSGIMVGPTLQNELHEQLSLLYLMIIKLIAYLYVSSSTIPSSSDSLLVLYIKGRLFIKSLSGSELSLSEKASCFGFEVLPSISPKCLSSYKPPVVTAFSSP